LRYCLGMEIATDTRPAIDTPVRVTFPARGQWDTETVTGVVTRHYPDGIDIGVTEPGPSHDVGEEFTLFDSQISHEGVTLEALT
jgi:hypothetical protein